MLQQGIQPGQPFHISGLILRLIVCRRVLHGDA